MKRFFLLLILLFSIPCQAEDRLAWISPAVLGGCVPGTTCTGNYGETVDGNVNSLTGGYILLQRTAFGCVALANDTDIYVRVRNCRTTGTELIWVIYADSAGEPGSLIWSSAATYWSGDTTDVAYWHSTTISSALSGTYLWIGAYWESGDCNHYYTSNSPTRATRYVSGLSFPTVPNPWNTAGDTHSEYGIAFYLSY